MPGSRRPYALSMMFPVVLAGVLLFQIGSACGEKVYFAGYNGGFYIRSEEEGGMDLRLGGALQADYRYFTEDERAVNGFDVRRARLVFRGVLTRWVRFGMEFEFQGNETDNLVDAYVEAIRGNHALRFGQFREPFSLEWQTRDKAQYFSERSMAWSLSPKRDVGLMLHGCMKRDAVCYALGLFNGDGDDGASRGNEEDTPELSGRLVLSPFRNTASALGGFQMGASFSWARIETLNVSLKVKSSGMATGALSVYELTHNTKFGVLKDVDARLRAGAEMAWAWGPLALMGEYVRLSYTDLEPVGSAPEDADFSAWYAAVLWNITGEPVVFRKGVLQPLYPKRFFNPDENSWGAFCLGVRVEQFNGDKDWINPASHVSSETADTCCLALSWVLFPMYRVIVDFCHTRLSDPVRARVRPDGSIDYVDTEQCLAARFSIDF